MLVVLLACCCLLSACGDRSKDREKAKVKFATKVLRPETLVYNLYIPASLHGMNEVDVYPQVSGIIRKVNFTDGIKVSRGQVLFVIDQTEHRLMVQNARANLAAARAQMETTKLKYESTEKLATKKIVSDYVLSTSANAYHEAQAAVQQAQAQLDIARTNLSYCTITSPITGLDYSFFNQCVHRYHGIFAYRIGIFKKEYFFGFRFQKLRDDNGYIFSLYISSHTEQAVSYTVYYF